MQVPKKYLISYRNKNKETWDMCIIILALQNSLVIPIDISFAPEFTQNVLYKSFDFIVDFLFLVDMVLMCFTTIHNSMGKEEFNSNLIIAKYIKSFRFVADLGAVLGTELFSRGVPSMKVFGFFKIIRILRLGDILQKTNVEENVKHMLNLMKFSLYLWIYIHVMACVWWSVISVNANKKDESGFDHSWHAPRDWLEYKARSVFREGTSKTEQYLVSLYHSVLMLGYNEMGPVNDIEILYCIWSMLLASLINAQIFSEMAVLIQKMQRKTIFF